MFLWVGELVDLLEAPIFRTIPAGCHSLPGLLAAMARDEIRSLPALRPHQRPAWHMFLVQLAALAIWKSGREDLPETETEWRSLLLALTTGDAGPWALTGPDDKPAFMQPPAPIGLNWKPVETPDALDLLITSRNHDLKQRIARVAAAEDWVFALVSLQTLTPFGGRTNYGIARMSSSYSSRMMFGLAPALSGTFAPNISKWWANDTRLSVQLRRDGNLNAVGHEGGPALLWCLNWEKGASLDITKLDPWFIEVARRVRISVLASGAIHGRRDGSDAQRIDKNQTEQLKGAIGDLWSPTATDGSGCFNIAQKSLDYSTISKLLDSSEWEIPPLGKPTACKEDFLLLVEGIGGGQTKTFGFKSRIVPIPAKARSLFGTETASTLAKTQITEIQHFDEALRNALARVAADGVKLDDPNLDQKLLAKNYHRSTEARARFDRAADRLFFPSLWDRLAESQTGSDAGYYRFIRNLHQAAQIELELAMPGIPCATLYRPRAEARARRAYFARLRKAEFQFLFDAQLLPDLPLVDEPEAADV